MRRVQRHRLSAALLTGALLLSACGDSPTDDGLGEPDGDLTQEPDAADDDADDDAIGEEDVAGDDDATSDGDDAASDDAAGDGPAPDEAALADPCADHAGREGEAFIDVVAPVAEQQVADLSAVELVGCSNVYEANVQWELYDGDGALLDEGFTTAECGSGCVGEFREELDLTGADGEPYAELHVFSENAADGSRDLLTEIPLVLG